MSTSDDDPVDLFISGLYDTAEIKARFSQTIEELKSEYAREIAQVERRLKQEDDKYFRIHGRHTERFAPTDKPTFDVERVTRPFPPRPVPEAVNSETSRLTPAQLDEFIARMKTQNDARVLRRENAQRLEDRRFRSYMISITPEAERDLANRLSTWHVRKLPPIVKRDESRAQTASPRRPPWRVATATGVLVPPPEGSRRARFVVDPKSSAAS